VRRRGIGLARTIIAALMASAIAFAVAHARPFDDVVRDGTLRVGVYRDNPPFSFHNGGTLVGIDVELGRRIAQRLGVEATFMEITAGEKVDDDLRNAVWKGHYLGGGVADIMLHVPYDPAFANRNPEAALFAPYAEEEFVLVSDPARVGGDPKLLALRSGKIGVELDSLPDFFLTASYGGALRDAVVHFPSTEAAAQALVGGELVAVMATRSRLEAALGDRLPSLQVQAADFRGFGRQRWPLGIAVKENARDLGYAVEDAITELMTEGSIAAIYRAYGVGYVPPASL
jgi:ABC-type amino acid transport substrate-binding protein